MLVVNILAPSYRNIAGEGEVHGLTENCEVTNSGFGALMFTFFGEKEIRY
jgi:hypothetical protein